MKVLFVDDEEEVREQARIYLEKEDEDIEITTASSGKEGLKLLERKNYDVIVSDYLMPGIDGIEFLKKVRARGNKIPLIIFTGKAGRKVADRAKKLGGNHFLLKGNDPKETYSVLAEYIKEAYAEGPIEAKKAPTPKTSTGEGEELKINVLLVDDEPDITKQAKIFLEKKDERLEILPVNSPETAIRLMEEKDFDAIVSDYKMPEMNGLEFLKKVRSKLDEDVPFIIFTGKGGREVAKRAIKLGGDHMVLKGSEPKGQYDVLADKIIENVERHQIKKAFTF